MQLGNKLTNSTKIVKESSLSDKEEMWQNVTNSKVCSWKSSVWIVLYPEQNRVKELEIIIPIIQFIKQKH